MIATTLDGVDVRANDDGNVTWMSDWSRCDELANRGLLRRVNYGPSTYGHTDFLLAVSPFVRRALARELPAKKVVAR